MDVRSFFSYRKASILLLTLFLVVFVVSCGSTPSTSQKTTPTAPPTTVVSQPTTQTNASGLAIHVSGNQLVNEKGQAVRLIGVNYPAGTECAGNGHTPGGILLAPSQSQTVTAMINWHVNVVRITMNEDCWLGINGVNPAYAGSNYQNTIIGFVNLLNSHGMYAIVSLHTNAPGSTKATAQQAMADADHATTFWQSVAGAFKNDPAVIFDAYNEPNITPRNAQTANPWQCWRDGCTINALDQGQGQGQSQPVAVASSWQAEGMQGLINAIRSTGATNPIMLGGLNFAENLTHFLQFLPTDPQHQLIASYHNYEGVHNTLQYWNSVIAPIAQQMPVVTGEFGEKDCQTNFVSQYMNWADQHNVSYLAWVWWTEPGCKALGLLTDWSGTPSAYGQVFYNHYRTINTVS